MIINHHCIWFFPTQYQNYDTLWSYKTIKWLFNLVMNQMRPQQSRWEWRHRHGRLRPAGRAPRSSGWLNIAFLVDLRLWPMINDHVVFFLLSLNFFHVHFPIYFCSSSSSLYTHHHDLQSMPSSILLLTAGGTPFCNRDDQDDEKDQDGQGSQDI